MKRVEKTIFLSYRRANAPWALAIFQHLHHQGYDVFFDYLGLASGDFEQVILENIRARAHFLVLLTPSALERCSEPGDWLRREIETAIDERRNVVPLLLEGFDFNTPKIADHLTGSLAALKRYNGLGVNVEYFDAAMTKLREKFLSVHLDAVLHPVSIASRTIVEEQKAAAGDAPPVPEATLTAQDYYERGVDAKDNADKVRYFSLALSLKDDFGDALVMRALAHQELGDAESARIDFNHAITLTPRPEFLMLRGHFWVSQTRFVEAFNDFDQVIKSDSLYRVEAHLVKISILMKLDMIAEATADAEAAIQLGTTRGIAYSMRGYSRFLNGDIDGAREDFKVAVRLEPNDQRLLSIQAKFLLATGGGEQAAQEFEPTNPLDKPGE